MALPRASRPSTRATRIAALASLMALAECVPLIPIIGGRGCAISLAAAFPPLAGVLLGPLDGAMAALLGALVGIIIAPQTAFFGLLSPAPCALGALTAGLMVVGARGTLAAGVLLLGLGLALLWLLPVKGFPWLHMTVGLILMLGSHRAAAGMSRRRAPAFFLAALAGTLADHSIGCLLARLMYGIPAEAWRLAMFTYPIERGLLAALAAAASLACMQALGLSRAPRRGASGTRGAPGSPSARR